MLKQLVLNPNEILLKSLKNFKMFNYLNLLFVIGFR